MSKKNKRKIKVLVVDDSAFMRNAIVRMLSSDPELHVIGTAKDGVEAVDKTIALKPDIITLDVEMPKMNGLEALKVIMDKQPTPVLMVSALTTEGAYETIKALELGAVDFIPKNLSNLSVNILKIKEDLIAKIKSIFRSNIKLNSRHYKTKGTVDYPDLSLSGKVAIVTIGSSTGGPSALKEIIPQLPKNIPVPILISQHMPPGFTRVLADRLNQISKLTVKEAEDGEPIEAATAYIAPGGKHMTVVKDRTDKIRIKLTEDNGNVIYKPSVDLMMISATTVFPSATLGVILTGMGHDGLVGMKRIKKDGGKTLAQDKESCIIFGMPKVVIEAGIIDKVVSLDNMAYEILNSL